MPNQPPIEPCIYEVPRTQYRSLGYKVVKYVTDQFGERRKVSEVFRGKGALDRARAYRDEIEAQKRRQRYYKPPARKVSKEQRLITSLRNGNLDALWELGAVARAGEAKTQEVSIPTFGEFIELGLTESHDGKFEINAKSNARGWLRRKIEETTTNNWQGKIGVWKLIRDVFCQVHTLTIDQIKGDHVDDFVRFMENTPNKHGKPYNKGTIQYYRADLTAMIKNFAAHCGVINPLEAAPPQKKPHRIKGGEAKVKVPTSEDMATLEKGLQDRLQNTKERYHGRRQWAWHVHQVLRDTGCRPGEILALSWDRIDRIEGCLTVSEAISDGDIGYTKTGKAKGDKLAGTRIVYVTPEAIAVMDHWRSVKDSLGFKASNLVFGSEDGTPDSDDAIRNHYKATGSGVTPYQMRHWRNDQLRRQGVPSEIRQAALGHLSDEINANYTHVRPEELKKYLTSTPEEKP